MLTRRGLTLVVVGCAGLVLLTGCLSMPWTRTGNQGGGSIISATTKILGNNVGALNPDEIQILADAATTLAGVSVPAVTDDQAAAVVTFMDDNGIQTIQDIEELIRMAEEDPDSVVISDEVLAVLETLVANLDQYQDLQNINFGA